MLTGPGILSVMTNHREQWVDGGMSPGLGSTRKEFEGHVQSWQQVPPQRGKLTTEAENPIPSHRGETRAERIPRLSSLTPHNGTCLLPSSLPPP